MKRIIFSLLVLVLAASTSFAQVNFTLTNISDEQFAERFPQEKAVTDSLLDEIRAGKYVAISDRLDRSGSASGLSVTEFMQQMKLATQWLETRGVPKNFVASYNLAELKTRTAVKYIAVKGGRGEDPTELSWSIAYDVAGRDDCKEYLIFRFTRPQEAATYAGPLRLTGVETRTCSGSVPVTRPVPVVEKRRITAADIAGAQNHPAQGLIEPIAAPPGLLAGEWALTYEEMISADSAGVYRREPRTYYPDIPSYLHFRFAADGSGELEFNYRRTARKTYRQFAWRLDGAHLYLDYSDGDHELWVIESLTRQSLKFAVHPCQEGWDGHSLKSLAWFRTLP